MANRHLARSVVLQALFDIDFNEKSPGDVQEMLRANAESFAPGLNDFSFMEKLAEGVLKRKNDLDTVIEKAAPDWPLEKISVVDRNVLRIGLFELLFGDRNEVPAKVAINEAIELAKTFGGDSSGRFVNGVLGSVYKEIGEPGKDEVSQKKKKEVPYEEMPIEEKVGAVVYAKDGNDIYVALVHDVFGHWTLSKGGLEAGEDAETGLKRIVNEELGLDITLGESLGENEYVASHPEKGKLRKHVSYYLVEAPFHDLKLGESGGLDDVRWFKLAEIVNLNMYDDIVPIFTQAINILLKS